MDRRLVVHAQLAISAGTRIEVFERVDELTGERALISLEDLDSGIRYRRAEEPRGDAVRWFGRVRSCVVTIGDGVAHTVLDVDADGDGPAAEATTALLGADAAVDAAKAEADRWGGSDRAPEPEAERFW